MDNAKLKEFKAQCAKELREYMSVMSGALNDIDPRLTFYILDAIKPIKTETSDEDCIANIYELLGIRKVFRLMATYPTNPERFRQWLRAIEGEWKEGKHLCGGVKFDTPQGAQHVRLMPYQVWAVAGMMLVDHDVKMNESVIDRRRLCSEANIFLTRKAGKTELGASLDFAEFAIMGDSNAQVSIVANDREQAIKIAMKAVKAYAYQVDPSSTNKMGGKLFRVNSDLIEFREGLPRTALIKAFAAGGKPKDGWNSEWVHNDEAGQGSYVNQRSDMENTVQELVGSGGVRRERMRLNTTTAGKVKSGPYKDKVQQMEQMLLSEMDIPLGSKQETPEDYWFAMLLRLDPWDYDGRVESLDHEYLFKRVNRSIGTTVQPTWYKERLHKALTGTEDERKEVLTKDFNIWQTERVNDWIEPELIRTLQTDRTIDDCIADEGWICFAGLDFSMGNDLHAVSYLAVRQTDDGGCEFFADLDAWVSQAGLEATPYRKLYERWIQEGHLHLSPGKTLEPSLPVDRIARLYDNGVTFLGFGYDAYKAKTPINALSAWVVEATGDNKAPRDYIVPVSQTFAAYNPAVEEMDYMLKSEPAIIRFSRNPLWPWEFGNTLLSIDERYENKKPQKRGEFEKVDNVQCLLSALMMYDRAEGKEQQ